MSTFLRRHWQPLVVVLVGLARAASVVYVVRTPTGTAVLLDLATTILFGLVTIAAVVCIALVIRSQSRLAVQLVLALALAGAGRYAAPDIGFALRDRLFRSLLPAFRQAVETYNRLPAQRTAEVPLDSLPPELRGVVNGVFAFGAQGERKEIWFFYGIRAPWKHRAWIYHADDVAAATLRGDFWLQVRPLEPHWYDAVD